MRSVYDLTFLGLARIFHAAVVHGCGGSASAGCRCSWTLGMTVARLSCRVGAGFHVPEGWGARRDGGVAGQPGAGAGSARSRVMPSSSS